MDRAMLASLSNTASDQVEEPGKTFENVFRAEPELRAALAAGADLSNAQIREALDFPQDIPALRGTVSGATDSVVTDSCETSSSASSPA
jgi:hypothetical protein